VHVVGDPEVAASFEDGREPFVWQGAPRSADDDERPSRVALAERSASAVTDSALDADPLDV
jgi:hypothetical protein